MVDDDDDDDKNDYLIAYRRPECGLMTVAHFGYELQRK